MIFRVKWIADLDLLIRFDKCPGDFIKDGLMDDQSPCRGATLACCAHCTEDCACQYNFEISFGRDDDGIVSAEFK